MYYICNLKHISCKFHKRKDVIYAVRGTAHTLFPVDGLCLCMTYPINGRAVTRAKSNRRVRFNRRQKKNTWDKMIDKSTKTVSSSDIIIIHNMNDILNFVAGYEVLI